MSTNTPLVITITEDGGWWDWTVEGDANARAPYCGGTTGGVEAAIGCALDMIRNTRRHPYQPSVRTEY